jgi:hypothetical protein
MLLGCFGSFQLPGSVSLSRNFSFTASPRWRNRKEFMAETRCSGEQG